MLLILPPIQVAEMLGIYAFVLVGMLFIFRCVRGRSTMLTMFVALFGIATMLQLFIIHL